MRKVLDIDRAYDKIRVGFKEEVWIKTPRQITERAWVEVYEEVWSENWMRVGREVWQQTKY